MRAVVHLVLFACGVVMAVGAFGPFVGVVQARHIRLADIRDGFATGIPLDGVQAQATQLRASYTVVLLLVALVMLLAGLFGSRVLGWLAVLAGIAAIAVPAWRLDQRFDRQLRDDYQHLLTGTWGCTCSAVRWWSPSSRCSCPVSVPGAGRSRPRGRSRPARRSS